MAVLVLSSFGASDMSKIGVEVVTRIDLGPDCSLRNARSVAASLASAVSGGAGIEIDCAEVGQADITFVQTIVSAERSCAARGLPFSLLAATESVRSAFERAGMTLPAASHPAQSGN